MGAFNIHIKKGKNFYINNFAGFVEDNPKTIEAIKKIKEGFKDLSIETELEIRVTDKQGTVFNLFIK